MLSRWRAVARHPAGRAVPAALAFVLIAGAEERRREIVTHVVDGDTVHLAGGESVRLVGIDTPEQGEPLYANAARYLHHRVAGRAITLQFDQTRRDHYRRLLAYLWLGDTLINERLVERGLARVYAWPPDTLHFRRLLAAQTAARRARRGLWALPPPPPESLYVIHPGRLRFHRPTCRHARPDGREKAGNRDSLLDLGYSACRTCRP